MKRILNKIVLIVMMVAICSCTFLSNGQVRSLQETATHLEIQADINDGAKILLAEDLGDNSKSIRVIDKNSRLNRGSAKTIREIVGTSEE